MKNLTIYLNNKKTHLTKGVFFYPQINFNYRFPFKILSPEPKKQKKCKMWIMIFHAFYNLRIS